MYFDYDPKETTEWKEAIHSVLENAGSERAYFLLHQLQQAIEQPSSYINTIPTENEPIFPGQEAIELRNTAVIQWNALMMVLRAVQKDVSLGGHLATYASSAVLYEVGFNHFFKAPTQSFKGDLIFIQGHAAPGIYARGYVEGRFTTAQLDHFRQEVSGHGLSAYPHPWLMPDFWQFPTVSMGLGLLQAIYQARLIKYLERRGLIESSTQPALSRKVWTFTGDGEMDELESLGALTVASREGLDNLIVVVNCNLQRLDGLVRGNGSIIRELERLFEGAGWHVIKVIWGSKWDELLKKDTSSILKQRMMELIDGEYQNYITKGPAYFRKHFFGKYSELEQLISDWSDESLMQLNVGGHDIKKVFSAYKVATELSIGQPVVILAKTIKGYGLGSVGEGKNIVH